MKYLKTITLLWVAILICHTANATPYNNHKIKPTGNHETRPINIPGLTATIAIAANALKIGETTEVTVTFSGPVTGFSIADLTSPNGTLSQLKENPTDNKIWTATFTPTADVEDIDNVITLSLQGVKDLNGNDGTGLAQSLNYSVDTKRPTASIVVAKSNIGNNLASDVTITFSEAITGFTTADLIANGIISQLSSSNGGITWTATLTPTADNNSVGNRITLANSGVLDGAGNPGLGTTPSNTYNIDNIAPTLSITSSPTILNAGETATITFTFSEDPGDSFIWNGMVGDVDVDVTKGSLTSMPGTGITRTATYTPTPNLSGIAYILVNGGVYTDLANNPGSLGQLAINFNTIIPTTAPTLLTLSADSDSGVSNSDRITNVNTPIITGAAEPGSTVTLYNGTTVIGTGFATNGNWSITTNALAEGIHILTAKADIAGNVSLASTPLTITTDYTLPTLSQVKIIGGNEISPGKYMAAQGHYVTVYFMPSEPLVQYPVLEIAGQTPPVYYGGENTFFGGTSLMYVSTVGVISYRISFQDLAGNAGIPVTTGFGSVTLDKTFPAVPTGLVATSGDTEVTLKWNANTDVDLAEYRIWWGPRGEEFNNRVDIPLGTTTHTLNTLLNGTTYYYMVQAVDQAGNPNGSTVSATPKYKQTINFGTITTKTYGDVSIIPLGDAYSSRNLLITYTAANPSIVKITGNTAKILKAGITEITATQAGDNLIAAVQVKQTLTVNKAVLTIKVEDKERFAGTANPDFTAIYTGFIANDDSRILTVKPVFKTSAELNSPIGPYDINASDAVADSYSFNYEKGTLTVKPGAPTSITLTGTTLFENQATGTIAGTLGSTSDDPNATFTYTLASGNGDNDNASFSIVENQIKTAKILDFETKSAYKIRVRSTTNNHLSLDKELTILLSDVNEIPTLATIANQAICYTTAAQTVALTDISAGPETTQTTTLAISSNNDDLFESLTATATGATTGTLAYKVKAGASGTANVTVTVNDNNGTANGGVETYSRTFVITVNALPVVAINSDKGAQISKGETVYLNATSGTSYVWVANNSIENGHNTATIKARPMETTTYTVTATNATGCTETKIFTITVLDDVAKVKATNIMSPNGDGYNDKWLIDHIDAYPNNEVKVFDKSGRLMYSKKGYDNSWDATLNGAPLAEGTYYYVIDFGPNKPKVKGFITITRPS